MRSPMLLAEKFEVAVARDAAGPEIVLDNEDRDRGVLGNHHRPNDARLGENHVIALGTDATKTFGLEDFDQLFIGDRVKLWHASVEAGESLAAH